MKSIILFLGLACATLVNAQVVETVGINSSVGDGMCTDSLGNVYMSSGGLGGFVIGRYSPLSDQFNSNFITGLVGPTDVELLNDSLLYITNYDIDAISSYNFNTQVLSTVSASNLDGPGGIEVAENGFIYVTNWGNAPQYAGHTITKISPSGNSWIYIDTLALYRPQAITFNHENQLIVHSNSNLYKVNTADSSLVLWSSLSSGVANIVFNSSDSCVYGAAIQAGQILKITPDGTSSTFAGSTPGYEDGDISMARFNSPLGITFSPDENILYISEPGSNRLRRILLQSFTGIEKIQFGGESLVYPNPRDSGQDLNIKSINNRQIDQIIISNLEGKIEYIHVCNGLNELIPASILDSISSKIVILKLTYSDGTSEYHKVVIK